jgi:hypothetical protein
MLFLTTDPALVVLYKQLREKSLQTLRGAIMISPRAEWDFVIRTANLYCRMGCDILALDLVKMWEFLAPAPPNIAPHSKVPFSPASPVSPTNPMGKDMQTSRALDGVEFDLKKLLRRRSSLVVADLPRREDLRDSHHEGTVEEGNEEEDGKKEVKESKPEQSKKPPPTQFQEPDSNSLLDAFGF